MNRIIERLETSTIKRATQEARASSHIKLQWWAEDHSRKTKQEEIRRGNILGSNEMKTRDIILVMHERKMAYLRELQDQLPELQQERDSCTDRNKRSQLEELIGSIENRTEELNYLLGTSHILGKYVDQNTTANEKNKLVLEYLYAIGDVKGAERYEKHMAGRQWDISLPHDDEDNESDDEEDGFTIPLDTMNENMGAPTGKPKAACTSCESTELLEDGVDVVCGSCGAMQSPTGPQVMTAAQIQQNGMYVPVRYSYQRSSHFKDRINQWLGTEFLGDISQEVYDRLLLQLKKEKVTSVKGWTRKKMIGLLKRSQLNEYYEHANWFIASLSGTPVPYKIDQFIVDTLVEMFEAFLVPFEKHKRLLCDSRHENRKNIIHISYLLRKFFGILQMHDYAESFPLLKNMAKIQVYEVVFKRCCEDLGWEFTPSI